MTSPSFFDQPEPLRIDAIAPATQAVETSLSNDAVDSRARLCFRSLALCLAALVLVLNALGLKSVVSEFVDHSQRQRTATAAVAEPMLAGKPAAVSVAERSNVDAPHAIMTVISILLIGEVVLALGLIRATFSMRIASDVPPASEQVSPREHHALPGVELLKAMTEAFGTVLKGLPKR